jgi:adenylate cyclase
MSTCRRAERSGRIEPVRVHDASGGESVLQALMAIDQVESTAELARLGDLGARSARHCLQTTIRTSIRASAGRVCNQIGDGTLATFPSVAAALHVAVCIHRALADPTRAGVRIGVHVGETLVDDQGQPFGLAVHVTARICACGHRGETHVTDAVADAIAPLKQFELTDTGVHRLKGIPTAVRIHRLEGAVSRGDAPARPVRRTTPP